MKHEKSTSLFQYWNRLRGNRPAPKRTEIEPADIKANLADTFILEQDTRGRPMFRLAGTRLCATFGRELKGFAFEALWREADRGIALRLAHSAFSADSVVIVSLSGRSAGGRECEFELVMLPLEGGLDHRRLLGSIAPLERPFWLGADAVVECRIETLRVIDPDREPYLLANRPPIPAPPLSPADAGEFEPLDAQDGTRRIRHLLVIEGGKEE